MKQKCIVTILLCGLFVGGFAFAQTGGSTVVNVPLDGVAFNQANEEVQNIDVEFCENDAKTKQYTFFAGQPQDICLEVRSIAEKDILLSWDFVDGTFTNDKRKNRACLGKDAKAQFGQYITGVEQSFVIPARGSIVKHATLQYPATSTGYFLGCLVYYTNSINNGGAVSFNILVRKAKFIDVTLQQQPFNTYLLIGLIAVAFLLIALVIHYAIRRPISRRTKKARTH